MTTDFNYSRSFPYAKFYLAVKGYCRTAEDYWSIAVSLADVDIKYSQIHRRIGNDMVLMESMIIADLLEFTRSE